MTRRSAKLALLASVAVAVGGCGSSSDESDSDSTTTEPAPAKTKAPSASAGAASETAKDTIKDFTFGPKSVTVATGGTVSWTNEDSANHNVAFDDKSVKGIGNLREGQSGKVSFAKAGSYPYVCTYHPGMEGTVVVK